MVNKRKIRRRRVVINSRPIKADKQPGLCEKYFRIFAFGVILISILTRVFDFSLKPASYKGLFINRPYCGLHSRANANRAWAAGNHVKYAPGQLIILGVDSKFQIGWLVEQYYYDYV